MVFDVRVFNLLQSSCLSFFQLKKGQATTLEEIEHSHIKDHQSYYNRTQLELNSDKTLTLLPTDQRLERVKADSLDPGLSQLTQSRIQ